LAKKPNKKRFLHVSDEEREGLFRLYCETQNLVTVAEMSASVRMKRANSTIRKIAKEDGWAERYRREVLPRARRKTEKAAADDLSEQLKVTGALKRATIAGLFVDLTDPKTGQAVKQLKNDPTISDAIRVMQYDEHLREKAGLDADEERTLVPQHAIDEAVKFIRQLTPAQIKTFGDYIVRKYRDPEEALGVKSR